MKRSIKVTVSVIGFLSIGAGLYSIMKGDHDEIAYVALLIGVALIGTALLTNKVHDQPKD